MNYVFLFVQLRFGKSRGIQNQEEENPYIISFETKSVHVQLLGEKINTSNKCI